VDPALFLTDLEAKPAALERLARSFDSPDWNRDAGTPRPRRVQLLGMGSSLYAAQVCARRLRAAGVDAAADYASLTSGYPLGPDDLVVAVSASGTSVEVLDAVDRLTGSPSPAPVLAVTNVEGSALSDRAMWSLLLHAGVEAGAVACRSFQHTGLLLHALTGLWSGAPAGEAGVHTARLTRRVARACADLLERRDTWLPAVLDQLDGPDGVWTIAPVERLSCAQQSALMVREGPRRPAAACESADWSHVDVYLTKTLDYRALMFTGSRYDRPAWDWMAQRGARLVAVGVAAGAAAAVVAGSVVVRHLDDEDDDVALHTQTLVGELVAAAWWSAG
jgi:fructoselysine-6-P-deglycase FrlB-like protein